MTANVITTDRSGVVNEWFSLYLDSLKTLRTLVLTEWISEAQEVSFEAFIHATPAWANE